ncbi:M20 family metallopeptidase [Acidipropionibacterium acidipropionici]|jgi:acetylornithine deacetylase/succinyl-diaminopimelate desuccinylase-like protein|uniref:M20 family metallopeptidase n=2 Tax=Acidipropionibacterium acidipropionici TaxID=1748 RepID=UPI0009DC1E6D|nr:M20 family metallopeptidase [Acidipropionibacterium acidipropionici]
MMSRADVVDLTCRLIGAASENPPGNEAAVVDELARIADELGLTCRVEPALDRGRSNVLVSAVPLRDGAPKVLLLGHSDVVPAGPGWTRDPFTGVVEDGRIYGRGAADTKGGVAAALVALSQCEVGEVDVVVAVTPDEEEGGRGAQKLVAAHPEWDVRACLVLEPTDLQVVRASKGNSYHLVDLAGVAAHASNPDNGRSAVTAAARVVLEIARWHAELTREQDPLIGPPSWNVGLIQGGSGTAVVPDSCRISIDRRLAADQTAASVEQELVDRLKGLGLESQGIVATVSTQMEMPGFVTAADDPFVARIHRIASVVTGQNLPVAGWPAACDGGFVSRAWPGAAIVICGPGDIAMQAHRPDESVAVVEVEHAVQIYRRTIAEICKESTVTPFRSGRSSIA